MFDVILYGTASVVIHAFVRPSKLDTIFPPNALSIKLLIILFFILQL